MSPPRRPFLSRPWLVTGVSLALAKVLILLLASPWEHTARADVKPLRFYCAAGMTKPVSELLKAYESEMGVGVEVTYDGSGKLLSTIRAARGQGDLYLAADASHIRIAQREGLAAEVLGVARLRPVLVVNEATYRSLETTSKPIRRLSDVLRDLKLVLANPELASIGQLSKDTLEKAGLWKNVQEGMRESTPRVSTVGTVNEVAQTVRTRDGFAGIVWSAVAMQFGLRIIEVPEFAHVGEDLQITVLVKSTQPTEALRLARYLTAADKGAEVFKKHHFDPIPDPDYWEARPTLRVSAGAMLMPGIQDVVKQFAQREGIELETTRAGCGLLVAQMKAIQSGTKPGKFPDAYFACDESFLADVQNWFDAGVLVARNPMVIVVPRASEHDIRSLGDLTREDLRVGLGHPANSALGKLTDDLLVKLKLHQALYREDRRKPVVHADAGHMLVNQVRAGALDAAVVYRSNVQSVPHFSEHLTAIDLNLPEAIATQPFAIARNSRHRHLAQRLLQAIVTPENAQRFQSLGFQWMHKAP